MSSQQDKWLAEYPHRILIQQMFVDMIKATQCPQCGRAECKVRRDRAHSAMFMPEDYVLPRCSFDLSGVKVQ